MKLRAHQLFTTGPCQRAGASAAGERAVAVSSFGKTYHMTGWKWVIALRQRPSVPKFARYISIDLFGEYPGTAGACRYATCRTEHYLALPDFYRQKRDILVNP